LRPTGRTRSDTVVFDITGEVVCIPESNDGVFVDGASCNMHLTAGSLGVGADIRGGGFKEPSGHGALGRTGATILLQLSDRFGRSTSAAVTVYGDPVQDLSGTLTIEILWEEWQVESDLPAPWFDDYTGTAKRYYNASEVGLRGIPPARLKSYFERVKTLSGTLSCGGATCSLDPYSPAIMPTQDADTYGASCTVAMDTSFGTANAAIACSSTQFAFTNLAPNDRTLGALREFVTANGCGMSWSEPEGGGGGPQSSWSANAELSMQLHVSLYADKSLYPDPKTIRWINRYSDDGAALFWDDLVSSAGVVTASKTTYLYESGMYFGDPHYDWVAGFGNQIYGSFAPFCLHPEQNADDPFDWRIGLLADHYDALQVAVAARKVLHGTWSPGDHTSLAGSNFTVEDGHSGSGTLAGSFNCEVYGWLEITAGTADDDRVCILTVNSKEYRFTIAQGAPAAIQICLLDPFNRSGVDSQQTRFPLDVATAVPANEGITWGINHAATFEIAFPSADVYTISEVALIRKNFSRITLQQAWKDWFVTVPERETDTQIEDDYNQPFADLVTDGRRLDAYGMTRQYVLNLATGAIIDDYGYQSIEGLAQYLNGFPGVTATLQPDHDTYLSRSLEAVSLFGGGGATVVGGVASLGIDLDASAGALLKAQPSYDLVAFYPGVGDVTKIQDGGAHGAAILYGAKNLRSAAMGVIFPGNERPLEAIDVKVIGPHGENRGIGTCDTVTGYYLSDLPGGRGEEIEAVEIETGRKPKSIGTWHSRFRWRAGFIISSTSQKQPFIFRGPSGMKFVLYVDDEGLQLWRFNSRGFDDTQLVIADPDIKSAQGSWLGDGTIICLYSKDGNISRITNYAIGRAGKWSDPVMIGSANLFAFASDKSNSAEFAALYNEGTGTWECWRKLFSEVGFTKMCDIVAVSADSNASLVVDCDAVNTLYFVYRDGSEIARRTSTNRGRSFNV
jgi:hypothetical protein